MPAAPTLPLRGPLGALMFGNFVVACGVLVVPGMLDKLAQDLQVSVPTAGQLLSLAALAMCLGAPLFAQLPRGASVVNLARGGHLVEPDLLAALDGGQLRHAVLDVFATEPLPPGHPFWTHPRVTVLPHVAALTDAHSAAEVVAANLGRIERGEPPLHLVDRGRGY